MESRSERRLVTCVFIDIVGSTDLTRTLGAERMQRTLSEAFSELSRIAAAEGGTVEKYIGDEVFVLFGAPLAHSDDVLRALRGAEASLRWARLHSEMGLRIGIETGEALVDLRAVDDRQRMAVGTCVNVAARLQAHAGPGEILVGPVCRAAAASFADFVELGPLELKGLGMVRAARLVGLVDTETLALPFVGRGAELARLRAQFERTKSGRATLALISGEPGIGKSRLADEFAGSAEMDASILRARFRPGTELGTSPLAELVAGTPVETLPAGVAHSAGLISDPRLVALPLIDRRNEIFVAWRDYLAVMARTRPLLIVLDDIQWAETEFVRLLDRLTFGSDTPLMVLATARPEFPAMTAFRPGEDHLVLELGRLDEVAAGALARVAGEREAARVQRAAGHPLFIVELVRARTALASDVPVNVQAAIGARLDELTPTERDLLQRAAVVGETFTVRDAALLAERDPAEVAGILGRLAHLRHVDAVDGAFRFHHSLVRDVAYGRLPIAVRMRLHARFAREGLRADQVGALAYHWWEALGPDDAEWVWEGDPEMPAMRAEALRAHITAGGQLAERFSSDRAFEIFEHALKLAAGPHEEAEVEEGFALALARNAKGDDATQHRFRAIELYRSVGARIPPRLYADTLDLAVFNWGYFQHLPSQDRMRALMDEGTAAARAEGDAIALVRLLGQRGYFTNDPTVLAEIDPILAGVADKRPFGDALWRLGLVHLAANDDCARALATFDLAFDLAQQGARFNEPEALAWHVIALFHVGDLARAEMSADRLLEISATKAAHTRQHALGTKALVRFGRGDWSGVQAIAREIRALVEANPDASWCLMGANAVGYDAIGELLRRVAPSSDAAPLVERMLPEAPATRAAVLLLPSVLAGAPAHEDEARRSYARETGLWERESVWDVAGVNLVLAEVAAERWNQVETELPRIDRLAQKGAGFAAALGAAIREEVAASRGGPEPRHEHLQRLGYRGISELLSYRVRESGRMAAGAR
jgi:class 3 adenylate cyclase/tetratricopeptide (TPR) repeat protein